MTRVKIQFWLLGAIFGSKFAKITDRDIETCGVVDLRSSDALRRETEYVNAQTDKGPVKGNDI